MWENMHITRKTRIFRFLLQYILVLAIIIIGFICISIINISTPPTSYSDAYDNIDI
mgnify:CR=1 FL=1